MTRPSAAAPRSGILSASIPVAAAISVFGAIYGAAARPVIGPALAVVSSLVVFSGAAQFTTVGLLVAGAHNLGLVRAVQEIAAAKDPTAGQVALAWLQAQGDDVVPIPGTKRRRYVEENVAALGVELDAGKIQRLGGLLAQGTRTVDMNWVNRDTPVRS